MLNSHDTEHQSLTDCTLHTGFLFSLQHSTSLLRQTVTHFVHFSRILLGNSNAEKNRFRSVLFFWSNWDFFLCNLFTLVLLTSTCVKSMQYLLHSHSHEKKYNYPCPSCLHFFFFQIFFRLWCFPNGKNRGRPKSTKPSQQQQAESVRSKQSTKAARRTTQKVFTAGKQRNKKHWRQFLKRTNAEMPVGIPGLKTQREVRKRATGAIH